MAYDFNKQTTPDELARSEGLNVLVYGPPGSGKTTMISTLGPVDKTAVISAEAGMSSLVGYPVRVWPVGNFDELVALLEDLEAGFAGADDPGDRPCEFLALDSVTEIVEQCFEAQREAYPDDSWAMYRNLKAEIIPVLKRFRDLPCSVYMTSESDRDKIDGRLLYQPRMPGSASDKLPHLFDFVFAARVEENAEGEPVYMLQTRGDKQYLAKSRDPNHKLEKFEVHQDLSIIREKILGE